jgi:Lar family restriction alleviation protein
MTDKNTAGVDLDKLAPCPFCGGEAHATTGFTTGGDWPHGHFDRVFCGKCQIRQLFHRTKADAIAAWNSRAQPRVTEQAEAPSPQIGQQDKQAKIDVRYEFEKWASDRGESAVYIGDGLYQSGSITDQAEAFAAGVALARGALTQAAPEAPAGYKFVPLVCTPEMRAAWDRAPQSEDDDVEFHGGYRAMIEAAPAPAAQQAGAAACQPPALMYQPQAAMCQPAATTASASSPDGYLNDDCDAPMANGACTECGFGPCRRAAQLKHETIVSEGGKLVCTACGTSASHASNAGEDTERLNFMVQHEAWVAFGKDGESCRVFSRNEDGDAMPMLGWGARHWRHDPREAIDAARKAIAASAEQEKK